MRKIICSFLFSAAFALITQNATAQIVPFKSVGTGNEYNTQNAEFGGPGQTAHLGTSVGGGFAIPFPTTDPLVLDWIGFGEFVGANGDTITFSGGGKVFLEPLGGGIFTAEWCF